MPSFAARLGLLTLASVLSACSFLPQNPDQERPVRPVAALQGRDDIVGLVMDVDDTVGARVRRQDEYRILQLMSKQTGHWKSVYKWPRSKSVWPLSTDRSRGTVLMISNLHGKSALVELSLADGKERIISPHPDVDVDAALRHAELPAAACQ